jgi:hypothetical protein
MHRSGPPRPAGAGPGSGAGFRVRRAAARAFGGSSASSQDPDLRVYLADMVRPYRLALREDLLSTGAGHNYGEMAEELIRAAVPEDEPVDLLVLAFAIPDVRPGRSTALYLSSVCPGEPLAFALCEQGAAAAHSALRLVRDYGRGGGFRRGMVIVLEQAAVHYEPAPTHDGQPPVIPTGAAAVALICDYSGTQDGADIRQHAEQTPDSAYALLGKEIAAVGADRDQTVVILGGGLAQAEPDTTGCRQVIRADPGQPFTGQWSALAGGLPGWTETGSLILLADYDSDLQCLSLSRIDTAAGETSPNPGAAADIGVGVTGAESEPVDRPGPGARPIPAAAP